VLWKHKLYKAMSQMRLSRQTRLTVKPCKKVERLDPTLRKKLRRVLHEPEKRFLHALIRLRHIVIERRVMAGVGDWALSEIRLAQ